MLGLKSKDLIRDYKLKYINQLDELPYTVRTSMFIFMPYSHYDYRHDYIFVMDNNESTILHEISHNLDAKFGRLRFDKYRQYRDDVSNLSLFRQQDEAVANVFAILAGPENVQTSLESIKSYRLSIEKSIHLAQPILEKRFVDMGIKINWREAKRYIYDKTGTIPKGLF